MDAHAWRPRVILAFNSCPVGCDRSLRRTSCTRDFLRLPVQVSGLPEPQTILSRNTNPCLAAGILCETGYRVIRKDHLRHRYLFQQYPVSEDASSLFFIAELVNGRFLLGFVTHGDSQLLTYPHLWYNVVDENGEEERSSNFVDARAE